jgi:hypothetical protein
LTTRGLGIADHHAGGRRRRLRQQDSYFSNGAGSSSADGRHSEKDCQSPHDRLRMARVNGHDNATFAPVESKRCNHDAAARQRERYAVMM